MFIQIEKTPNPNSLKFCLEREIIEENRSLSFKNGDSVKSIMQETSNAKEKKSYDILLRIFDIEEVSSIFVSQNFFSISKASDKISWDILKPQVFSVLIDFVSENLSFVSESTDTENTDMTQIEQEIVELLEERVKPAVAMDGGNIELDHFDADTGTVYVKMEGSCSGCPSSSVTLKDGVERMLQYYVPEVKEVVPI